MHDLTRRDLVLKGSAAFAGYAALRSTWAEAFPSRPGETVLPWADQPPPLEGDPTTRGQLVWEEIDSWITPNDKFFGVTHLEWPEVDASTWKLKIDGLVRNPLRLTLGDLKARPRVEQVVTLECSGNHGFDNFTGAVGNARWAGTDLKSLLEEAGIEDSAIEVIFWGADKGVIELHDDIRDVSMTQHFARSMSLADAMQPTNFLAWEMNGEARIELRDRRFENRFMGRDYVTIREEVHDGETVWVETSVGPGRLKSAPARVTVSEGAHQITGAAWGAPIDRVEVRIDDGPWQAATIDTTEEAAFAWKIWYLDWPSPGAGEHSVTSRAIDTAGHVQPAVDDPVITGKHTYWESNGQITRRIVIEG